IAQWKSEIGCETDEDRWRALMAAAGLALGKLVEAYAVHYTAAGAQRLLHQISWFLNYGEVREHLEAARGGVTLIGESTDHIVDALLGLREEEECRRKARMSQRGASRPEPASQEQQEEQEVAGQDDAGWDF